jgi:hypothetical protein
VADDDEIMAVSKWKNNGHLIADCHRLRLVMGSSGPNGSRKAIYSTHQILTLRSHLMTLPESTFASCPTPISHLMSWCMIRHTRSAAQVRWNLMRNMASMLMSRGVTVGS